MGTPAIIFFAATTVTLIGWLVVPRITNNIAITRERKLRKRVFVAFLSRWQDEIRKYPWEASVFSEAYESKLPAFTEACALVFDDFRRSRCEGFRDMTDAARRFGGVHTHQSQQESETRRHALLKAIDDLIQFIRTT